MAEEVGNVHLVEAMRVRKARGEFSLLAIVKRDADYLELTQLRMAARTDCDHAAGGELQGRKHQLSAHRVALLRLIDIPAFPALAQLGILSLNAVLDQR
jgi:hypothetical protein